MESTDMLFIKGIDLVKECIETIRFSKFIEEVLNAQFEEIYKDYIIEDDNNNEQGELE